VTHTPLRLPAPSSQGIAPGLAIDDGPLGLQFGA